MWSALSQVRLKLETATPENRTVERGSAVPPTQFGLSMGGGGVRLYFDVLFSDFFPQRSLTCKRIVEIIRVHKIQMNFMIRFFVDITFVNAIFSIGQYYKSRNLFT